MKETVPNAPRRKWRKRLLILLAVLLAHWFLMVPAEVDTEFRSFSPPDSYSVGRGSLKTLQVCTPLFPGGDSWSEYTTAAGLLQFQLPAAGTKDIRMNFGLLVPHKVEVTSWEVREIDASRSIDLWLKYSTPRDVPHTYTPGLLEIPLTRDDSVPTQLLVIEATWYGILGPRTGTYAVTVNGWRAVT